MLWPYKSVLLLEPPVCLGRRLKPLTCGMANILQAYDSPFAGNGQATLQELVFAVWVCSQADYGATLAKLRRRCFMVESKRWAAKVGAFDLKAEVGTLRRYLLDHMTARPPRWDDEQPAGLARAPWPWMVTAALMRVMPERDAWNYPVNAAWCRLASMAVIAGDKDVMSEKELKIADQLNEGSDG